MTSSSLPAQFEAVVDRYPDRLAVKTGARALTYGELNTRANRLARAILGESGAGTRTVGLLLEHGVPLALGVLACLKAGKAYVPLELNNPPERQARILADAGAALLVTDQPVVGSAADGFQVLSLEAGSADGPSENLGIHPGPDELACVLYTSGSTGMPKGVMYSHGMILVRVVGHNRFGVGGGDRLSALGAGGMNLFRALLTGAALISLDVRRAGAEALPGWLQREGITLDHSVPTLFRHLITILTGAETFSDLRVVNLTGEALLRQDVEAFRRHFPEDCLLVHGLGTTEAATFRELRIDRRTRVPGRVVPVGFSVEGTEVLLLDESGRPTPPGEIGEIAVRGTHLALGYWKRPDLTAAQFLPDPAGGVARLYRTGDLGRFLGDGSLMHLGRADSQIKVRGHRVEAGEVESVLLNHPAVEEVAVVGRPEANGGVRLHAYVIPTRGSLPSARALRSFLQERLPDYMVPSELVSLDALPLTPNGKVDRQALLLRPSERLEDGRAGAPPRGPLEACLTEIWCDVFRLPEVGINDDFFVLGGDSLHATRLTARLRDRLRVEVPLQLIFEHPTIAEQAAALVAMATEPDDQAV